jgi:hypothetical protein
VGERFLIGLIKLYRFTLGRIAGGHCRFHPSCSEYAMLAVRQRGAMRGAALALWRLIRCGPWTAGGVDYPPVPDEAVVGARG